MWPDKDFDNIRKSPDNTLQSVNTFVLIKAVNITMALERFTLPSAKQV